MLIKLNLNPMKNNLYFKLSLMLIGSFCFYMFAFNLCVIGMYDSIDKETFLHYMLLSVILAMISTIGFYLKLRLVKRNQQKRGNV